MSIKSDKWIIEQAEKGMITPFVDHQVRTKDVPNIIGAFGAEMHPIYGIPDQESIISYGVSSYGYDIRAADDWKVFTNLNSTIVDPKEFNDESFVDVNGKGYCIIPPNSFALARSIEYMRIPSNVLVVCLGKSTYARCGIIVNVTPLEPDWEGHITLEFSNTTPLPAKIYAGEGVAQLLFFESDEQCSVTYKDRGGKYQGQTGVTLPKA